VTRRPVLQVMAAFRSTLPTAQDVLDDGFPVDGHALSSMSLFGAPNLQMEGGIWYGVNRLTGEFVIVDPFAEGFDNFNSCVIGKSGGGKSVTLKERALRSLPLGIHHTVLDPANEYVALAQAIGGQVVYLSPGSRERINPLDLPTTHRGNADAGDLLSNHIESVQGLLALLLAARNELLSETEKGVLDAALAQTYAAAGITADPATHTHPAPTLADLKRVLDEMDDAFHLGLRLARYCTGALRGLFGGTTTVTRTSPLTVFAMRDLSEDLWPAAMYLVSQHTWRQAYAGDGIRRCMTVDECHRMFDEPSGAGNRLLGRLIREGRKYLLGVETATQDPGDYLLTSGGRASVVNANTVILLKQNEGSLAALRQVIALSEPEEAYLRGCEKGQGLLIAQDPEHPGERMRIPLRVMMSPSHEPYVRRDGFLSPPSA
jgi:type IV secretory pathway VirB4 component